MDIWRQFWEKSDGLSHAVPRESLTAPLKNVLPFLGSPWRGLLLTIRPCLLHVVRAHEHSGCSPNNNRRFRWIALRRLRSSTRIGIGVRKRKSRGAVTLEAWPGTISHPWVQSCQDCINFLGLVFLFTAPFSRSVSL